ncbi:hypothetical protein JAAARDRAFT_194232 [Jaapia argillacea MUCL 33604]|uniref:Zn(2)-C6 fungal-type domain-containing protein n=1 Tax=Jaapia argillacea MUCL 33604 TaxID=933084 RepID=A0A067PQL7_9AGAM|nr:hypothetical protein JAAARDRAFT_194232 [Jaapia argillacea MUCL 33604]
MDLEELPVPLEDEDVAYGAYDDRVDSEQEAALSRKRISRACDQCRKLKSKCDAPATDGPCRSCASAHRECTFRGPTYKRGPPKGYLHAVEQRWYQAETILGAILASPDGRARDIVSALQLDPLAREVLNRIDVGPFAGPSNPPVRQWKMFFVAFSPAMIDNRRGSRDSQERYSLPAKVGSELNVFSESVTTQPMFPDLRLTPAQTAAWQDDLTNLLGSTTETHPPHTEAVSANGGEIIAQLTNRRRLAEPYSGLPDFSELYTMDKDSGGGPDTEDPIVGSGTDAMGQLSLDSNRELRFHGEASGLHLLGESARTDDMQEGGVWNALNNNGSPEEETVDVKLPPIETQDRLTDLFFTYFHPSFPVLHKPHFFAEYTSSRDIRRSSTPPRDMKPSKLLLFSIFCIAERFADDAASLPRGRVSEAGCGYLETALDILNKVYHHSRRSTCQALLLLGVRELGIGCVEHGSLYISMAINMAQDLGMHRIPDKWQYRGQDVFSVVDKQIRNQIWWCCIVADRYVAVHLGKPVGIKDNDFDALLPPLDETQDGELWSPDSTDPAAGYYNPVPSRFTSCFRAFSCLNAIIGNIVEKIYPVRPTPAALRLNDLAELENKLDRFYNDLPARLTYDPTSIRLTPPPHVLFLHVQYWSAVILLHRPLPTSPKTVYRGSVNIADKAFDFCEGSATHISTLITIWKETFGLRRCPPLLASYILGAGIMHVVILAVRPSNVLSRVGLSQCLAALKAMETAWPSAQRSWELLHGVKGKFEGSPGLPFPSNAGRDDHPKRKVEDSISEPSLVFGPPQNSNDSSLQGSQRSPSYPIQDFDSRMMMAGMLGLDVPDLGSTNDHALVNEAWPYAMELPSSQPWAALFPALSYQSTGGGNDWAITGSYWPNSTTYDPSSASDSGFGYPPDTFTYTSDDSKND